MEALIGILKTIKYDIIILHVTDKNNNQLLKELI